MKLVPLLLVFLATAGNVASFAFHRRPGYHRGFRGLRHGRAKKPVTPRAETVHLTIVDVALYKYKGSLMTKAEVCNGLIDGSIPKNLENLPDCSVPDYLDQNSTHSRSRTSMSTLQTLSKPLPGSTLKPSKVSSAASSSTSAPATSTESTEPKNHLQQFLNSNVDRDFPSGKLDCSMFPSEYGAIEIPWVGLGGWTAVQYAQDTNGAVSHLATAVQGGSGCSSNPGSLTYCSYACPPGYQKSQWPQIQGSPSMPVSVGGILCGSDNKLYLSNDQLSTKLCIPGTGVVSVKNELDKNAAICRTDYPGTEDETVPLNTFPGSTMPLTCPDAATYYKHLGSPTTAQYYVNPMGVSIEEACQWESDKTGSGVSVGNWAPVVIGVGQDENGDTWLSIMTSRQNMPERYNELDFSIELVGDFGGSNACFYTQEDGKGYYCTAGSLDSFDVNSNCKTWDPNSNPVPGCTVQLMSGTATYVLKKSN